MEINGLPVHVLAVHAAVVLGPLASGVALAYAALPSWRDRLRWMTLIAVLVATASIWVAYLSGESFFESDRYDAYSGEALEKIETHESFAEVLRLVTSGFAVVTILAFWLHTRTGAVRIVLRVLLAVGAIATRVWTFLTGEAGALSVWGQ